MSCIGLKGQALKDCKAGMKFTLLAQARQNTNRANLGLTAELLLLKEILLSIEMVLRWV